MATTIYFNSRLTAVPGSYTEVDASGLASVGLGATGVVACIGEVEGSEPGTVHSVTNPGKMGRIFRSGDLLEGGTMLFDPSKDPDIPGGAQEVKFVKVNPAQQSSLTLDDDLSNPSLDLTSKDYGAFTDKINVAVSDGTIVGTKAVTVNFESVTEVFDNIGEEGVGTVSYAGPGDAAVVFTHAGGLEGLIADTTVGLENEAVFEFQSYPGLDSQLTGQPTPSETLDIVSSDAGDTSYPVLIYGELGGLPVSELILTDAADGTIQTAGVQPFDVVHGIIFISGVNPIGTITIDGNTSATVIVATSLLTRGVSALMSAPNPAAVFWDSAGGSISTVADGASTDHIMYVGFTVGGIPAAEVVTLNGTTPVVTLITDWSELSYILTGALPGALEIIATAQACMDDVAFIASGNPADTTQTVTIYGVDAGGFTQSESVALNGTIPVFSAGVWSRIDGVILDSATAGDVFVGTGNNSLVPIAGRILSTVLSAGTLYSGIYVAGYSYGQPGALNWSASDPSFSGIVIGIDGTASPAMELIFSVAGTTATTWGHVNYLAMLTVDPAVNVTLFYTSFTLTEASFPTFADWENFFALISYWSLAKTSVTPADQIQIARLDEVFPPEALSPSYTFRDVLSDMAEVLTKGSAYIDAETASGATAVPANTLIPLYLSGGTEGVTVFSDWQNALDLIRDYRVNTVIVLTSDPAVQAATIAHCKYMCGAGRSERDCVLGAPAETTLDEAKALALSMNSRNTRLIIQGIERFNTSGVKETFPPQFTACLAAGMQAGSDVGTSLTFKYLNVLRVEDNTSTYNIQDDGNTLIQSGLDVIAKVPNVGHRWLRNVTTYLIDDNLAYVEASVNEAVNYAVYNFRTALEVMVGKKGFSGTVTATQGLAVSILGQLVGVGAITAWKNLTITLTGDTMTVDVEIAPIIPVNFIKTTIHLVSSTFESTT